MLGLYLCVFLNPLTTDDAFWCCLTWFACYQLVQFILKVDSVLTEKGEVGGCHPEGDSA